MAEQKRPGRGDDRRGGPRSSGPGKKPGGGPGDKSGGGPGGKSGGGPRNKTGGGRGPASGARGRDDSRAGARGGRAGRDEEARGATTPERGPRRSPEEQAIYDGPPLPDDVTGAELDRAVAGQLKGLPEKLAARVARHLVAAGLLIESDPETAYRHCLAARARATRLAVIREATGEAAYAAGHYSEALSELRAAKRMNGAPDYLPIMADCHRALGQPEQALKLARSPSVANFEPAAKAEMTIVEAGARRDLGQLDAALRTLEQAPLMSRTRAPWVVRLRYAYADVLEAAERPTDALAWFHRTHAIDGDELTDATDRAAALENRGADEA